VSKTSFLSKISTKNEKETYFYHSITRLDTKNKRFKLL